MSRVTKRIVKRSTIDDDDDFGGSSILRTIPLGSISTISAPSASTATLVGGSNYTVHRGMSPTTANRIQNRVLELEEALEAERATSLRYDRQIADLNLQLVAAQEKVDEADNEIQAQIDANRRGEADYLKLRKDYDTLLANHEASETNLKKKFSEIIKDLEDQLDRTRQQKAKLEKEKHSYVIEIENLNTTLDQAGKNNSFADQKFRDLEEQLRKLNAKVGDLTKQNAELLAIKNKLSQENGDLLKSVHDYETKFGVFSSNKTQIQTQLEDLRSKYDDELRSRGLTTDQLNQVHNELDRVNALYEEELEAADGLRGQVARLQAEYLSLKTKYDKDLAGRGDELEELRRKLSARIGELESEIENLKTRNGRLEKDKSKLNLELKDYSLQLEDANSVIQEHIKRAKQLEHLVTDLQKKNDELNNELQRANLDLSSANGEITRLKALAGDLQDKIDALTRENAKLADANREHDSNVKDLNRTVQELTIVRSELTGERDNLLNQLHDLKDEYQLTLGKLDSAGGAANQIRIDLENKLKDRDTELDAIRHRSQTTITELQTTVVDLENKLKNEGGRLKKKHAQEIQELQIQLDALQRANIEFEKAKKGAYNKIRELESALELERKGARDAKDAAANLERRVASLLSELDDLKSLYDASEKARKKLEADNSDSSQHMTEINVTISNLQNDRKRLEADLAAYEHRFADADSARRAAEDRADRLAADLIRVNEQLKSEQSNYSNLQAANKQLEVQIRELSIHLEDLEFSKDGRKALSQYKTRIADLERELESEQRRGKDAGAELQKLKRQLQDTRVQAERDHLLVIEYADNINNWQAKFNALKSQLEQNEEVLTITMNKYRKVQAELDDAQRRADRAEAQNAATVRHHTTILGGAPPLVPGLGRTRAMSVTKEVTSRFIR